MNPTEFIAQLNKEMAAKKASILTDYPETIPVCKCGAEMVKRFGNGEFWCPLCGIFERDIALAQKIKSANSRHQHNQLIRANNMLNPLYKLVYLFSEKILADYGFKGRVIFRSTRGSCHKTHEDGSHTIQYGYECVDHLAEEGYQEYKTYRHLWPNYSKLLGKKAVWALVIHESAHAIQHEKGGRFYGSQHNPCWAEAVKELQTLYPYEEVKRL